MQDRDLLSRGEGDLRLLAENYYLWRDIERVHRSMFDQQTSSPPPLKVLWDGVVLYSALQQEHVDFLGIVKM